jgi:hypothetical protein
MAIRNDCQLIVFAMRRFNGGIHAKIGGGTRDEQFINA